MPKMVSDFLGTFFLVFKFPASGGELVTYVQVCYQTKGFKGHFSYHDLLTPQPLKRADFFGLTI